jgi:hypothetical protein
MVMRFFSVLDTTKPKQFYSEGSSVDRMEKKPTKS